MKYRVFVQDVGRDGFSGFDDVEAISSKDAISQVSSPGWKYIAIPHARKDLWPDRNGNVSREATSFK